MPVPSSWSAVGLSRGLCSLRPVAPLLSCQSKAPSFLEIARPTSRHLNRPSRPAFLGVTSRLRSQQGLPAASKGLPKPASIAPLPGPVPIPIQASTAATSTAAAAAAAAASTPGHPLVDITAAASTSNQQPTTLTTSIMASSTSAAAASAAAAAGSTSVQPHPQQADQLQQHSPQGGSGAAAAGGGGGGGGPAAPPSPSVIHLTVASGAVVAPELDYTVVLDMLHKNAGATAEASQQGGVVLGLTSPVGATPALDITIGQLNFKRLLACARNKLWWMTPEWRTASWQLPPETQFLLAEMADEGPYALLLPLIDGDFRATLRPPAK